MACLLSGISPLPIIRTLVFYCKVKAGIITIMSSHGTTKPPSSTYTIWIGPTRSLTFSLKSVNRILSCSKCKQTNIFIRRYESTGLAYDLKSVSEKMIKARTERTGDGIPYKYTKCVVPGKSSTVDNHSHEHTNLIWGWDDKDLDQQDKQQALIYNKEKLI